VYWFSQLNSKNPWKLKDKKKREVILYCGPSNKSVDVVAGTSRFVFWGTSICVKKKLMDLYACVGFTEYLLKFGEQLKLLRVYSRQMEMQEYPYPGSNIQLSHKSLRQERSKSELRYYQ